jgi:hypothetical protein
MVVGALLDACGPIPDNPLGGPFGGILGDPIAPTEGGMQSDVAAEAVSMSTPSPMGGDSGPPPVADDANGQSDSPPATSSDGAAAPTWTGIYNQVLTVSTCGVGPGGIFAGTCHQKEFSSVSSAYDYIHSQCPVSTATMTLTCMKGTVPSGCSSSCGNMPLSGDISAAGYASIKAWIAAGAQNN